MRSLLLVFFATVSVACSSAQPNVTPAGDAATDAVGDTGSADTGTVDTGIIDTGTVDTGTPPVSTVHDGQCYNNGQCTSGGCDWLAPGGACECSSDADCSGTFPKCNTSGAGGLCTHHCSTDADCPPDNSCMTNNLCGPKSCTTGLDCSSEHVCSNVGGSNLCVRVKCTTTSDCPDGTTCHGGLTGLGYCSENDLTFPP